MTPRKDELTPKAVIRWMQQLRRASLARTADKATQYQIQYMFKYIENLVQYQDPMPPEIEEDESFFTCKRCGDRMKAEAGIADDYMFCPLCGQRWKDD